jgi:hypothetical protein
VDGQLLQFFILLRDGFIVTGLNGEYVTHVVKAKKPAKGQSVTAECSGIVGIN